MNLATDSPILKTKLTVPGLKEHLVTRDRLLKIVSEGQRGHITTIIAPAGFGKSTLLSQWAHSSEEQCAWVSLDERDNDPVRFWRYIAAALASVLPEPQSHRLMNDMHMLPGVSITTFLDTLISELYEWNEQLTLVLDDLHSIHHKPIHDGLSYFIDYLPDQIHLLIASRTELPFSTIKGIVNHEVTCIGMNQLQFTSEETGLFFRLDTGDIRKELTPLQLDRIWDRTEGWITGLQLLALSLRSGTQYEQLIEDFKGDYLHISKYLFQEVVESLPPEVYRFLLQTSVLSRMNAETCNAVTGQDNGRQMLEELQKRNLFLIPLDASNSWFRYHHLFSQFLQDLFQREDDKDYAVKQRLAGQYFASIGSMDEAIDHMFAAQEIALAVDLLEPHIQLVLERGELSTILQWFSRIPAQFPLSLEMSLLHTFILVLTGDLLHSDRMLTDIEEACTKLDSSRRREQLKSGILFVRSNLVFLNGDFAKWFAFSEGILDNLMPDHPIYYQFDYNRQEPYVRRTSLGMKGALSADTEKIAQLFTGVLESHGWKSSLIHLYVKQSLCEGYYEWNRLAACRQILIEVRNAPPTKQTLGLWIPLQITEARLYAAETKYHLAYSALDEASSAAASMKESKWLPAVKAMRSIVYIREGRVAEAKKELAGLHISAKDKPTYSREIEYLALIRLLSRQRKEAEALHLLELLKPQAEREQQISSIVEILCLQALLEYQRGQRALSLKLLDDALLLGMKNGYVRSFLDEGMEMHKLLTIYWDNQTEERKRDAEQNQMLEYVRMLIDAFPDQTEAERLQATSPLSALPEQLNRTEMHLLHLIRQGAANKQMAAALGLSEGTIRVYLSRLYDKLGVASRTQALVKAQSLELLED